MPNSYDVQKSISITVRNSKDLSDNAKREMLASIPPMTLELRDDDGNVILSTPASPKISSKGSVILAGSYGQDTAKV